ncbi:MAG: hypothetical protein OXG78_10135 [Chloroflexi bacterium]|nr:hypothetical protein [Chloroflexota bacterium]
MSDVLLSEALRLAERPYQIEVEREPGGLSPDIPRYTASIKEMPYCVAQGFTEQEARNEIRSVLTDYILSLLARDVEVPDPELKPCRHESDYAVQWLWEGCFVYAEKGVLEKLTGPTVRV